MTYCIFFPDDGSEESVVMDANVADQLIVVAHAANQGISLFLVDAKNPGIQCTKMPTIGRRTAQRLALYLL